MRAMVTCAAVLALCLAAGGAWADDARTARVDAIFEKWDTDDTPGCAVGILKDGRPLYTEGYGMADLEYGAQCKPDTIFFIGSMSKQFTAACVHLLAERGELSLEEDIRKYVPELPDYGHTITLQHLIEHSSGLREYINLAMMADIIDGDLSGERFLTDERVLDLVFRQEGVNFAPGDRFAYCNTGYLLLRVVVERVTGKPIADFMREAILEPLGMDDSLVVVDNRDVIPGRARGYLEADGGYRASLFAFCGPGPAGVWSTVEDLLKWETALSEGAIGRLGFTERLYATRPLNNGTESRYAAGFFIGSHRGLPMVHHGGDYPGFHCEKLHFPEQGYTFICLANIQGVSPASVTRRMADIYLDRYIDEPEPAEEEADANADDEPEVDATLLGEYVADNGQIIVLHEQEGALVLSPKGADVALPLRHIEGTTYGVPQAGLTMTFQFDEAGDVVRVDLTQGDHNGWARPIGRVEHTEEQLAEFAGRYYSHELDAYYTIRVAEGSLRLDIRLTKDLKLDPGVDGDSFILAEREAQIAFERDDTGTVIALTISDDRVHGVRFERLPAPATP